MKKYHFEQSKVYYHNQQKFLIRRKRENTTEGYIEFQINFFFLLDNLDEEKIGEA